MPVWISVYCRGSTAEITPEALRAGLLDQDPGAPAGVDYRTLAEQYGLARSHADQALQNLKVAGAIDSEKTGPICYAIHYDLDNERPVLIYRWTASDRVAEELEEVRHRLSDREGSVARRLSATKEVIGIELGIGQFSDMGIVFAYEAARYLAQRGDGIIRNDQDAWIKVENGAFIPLR